MPPTATAEPPPEPPGLASRHECGLFAAVALTGRPDVVPTVLAGLGGLQHRGQQSAGVVLLTDEGRLVRTVDLGLVPGLSGRLPTDARASAAFGHVRYATYGSRGGAGAQPVLSGRTPPVGFAFAGHVVQVGGVDVVDPPDRPGGQSDAQLLAERLGHRSRGGLLDAVGRLVGDVDGALNLLVLTPSGEFVAGRDGYGFRPLHWAVLDEVLLVSTEDHVLRALGADARELAAGELLHAATGRPGAPGRVTVHRTPRRRAAACSFEFVYFGHPAATFEDRSLHAVRERFGFALAGEETLSSDRALVVPVPATGAVAARAYAQRLGLPLREAITTDRYHSRTFIGQPPAGVRPVKHHVVVDSARDQDAVLVDDSLVRGATLGRLLSSFRRAARPRSVHVRIAAPPVLHPCFYGIDIPDRAQLRAARAGLDDPVHGTRALDALAAELGADSVRYLSLAGFRSAFAPDADRFCYACLDGDYPTPAGARRAAPRRPAVPRALPPHARRPCSAEPDRSMRLEPCLEEA